MYKSVTHTNWDTLTEEVERDGEVPEGVPKLNAPLHTVILSMKLGQTPYYILLEHT